MRRTSVLVGAYAVAGILTLAWIGVCGVLLFGGVEWPPNALAVRLAILVVPVLVSVVWLFAGRLTPLSRTEGAAGQVTDDRLISELNRAANLGQGRNQLLVRLAESTLEAFSSNGANVYLRDNAHEHLVLLWQPASWLHGLGIPFAGRVAEPRIRLHDSTWYATALRATEPVVTSSLEDIVTMVGEFEGSESFEMILPTLLQAKQTRSVVAVPLLCGDLVLGIIDMSRSWPFTTAEAQRFQRICDEMAVILSRIDAEERLSHLARHDPLTGLENRHAFLIALNHALALVQSGSDSAVFFIDIDNFKRCNDERGHAFGDEVLVSVAHLLTEQVREVDLVARIGGDEFAALLANTTEAAALPVAERMRASVKALGGEIGIPISLSIGIAGVDPGATAGGIVAVADQRMYRDKAAFGGARRVRDLT